MMHKLKIINVIFVSFRNFAQCSIDKYMELGKPFDMTILRVVEAESLGNITVFPIRGQTFNSI